jgi:hypothetical protein
LLCGLVSYRSVEAAEARKSPTATVMADAIADGMAGGRLNQDRRFVRGEALECLVARFADDVPEQRQHCPGVCGKRKRPRPAIGEGAAVPVPWFPADQGCGRATGMRWQSIPRGVPGNSILSIYILIMTLPKWQPDLRYSSARAMSCISNVSSITGLIPRCSIIPIMRSNISTDPTTTP